MFTNHIQLLLIIFDYYSIIATGEGGCCQTRVGFHGGKIPWGENSIGRKFHRGKYPVTCTPIFVYKCIIYDAISTDIIEEAVAASEF